MAFTRKFLSALGIETDKVDEIISAHMEVVDAIKEERDTYKADADKLANVQKELAEANEKIAKNGDEETVLKSEFDAVKKEYEDYKGTIEAEKTHTAKETAYRELLKAENISTDWIDRIVKVSNIDSIELDAENKIKDSDKLKESINGEWGDYKVETSVRGTNASTPPETNNSKDPFEQGFDEG